MENVWQLITAVLVGIGASSGFWTYLQSKDKSKSATTRLLMGLAYDRITTLGMGFIDRGWVTQDEYEELRKYFFEPYKEFGGNGTAEKIMEEVGKLPFKHRGLHTELLKASVSWKEDEAHDRGAN